MKNKKGFTLTEILLAVMIVGIIGVALVSLTTAASRESGVGRSKIMLRNNLSLGLRQIRRDIQSASRVLYVRGPIADIPEGGDPVALLMVATGFRLLEDGSTNPFVAAASEVPRSIRYCFYPGNIAQLANGGSVLPVGALDGGIIRRFENNIRDANGNLVLPMTDGVPDCPVDNLPDDTIVWRQVKYIPSGTAIPLAANNVRYPVPLFQIMDGNNQALPYSAETLTNDTRQRLGSQLRVHLIVETPSSPVVNEAVEETFFVPNGVVWRPRPAGQGQAN